MTVSPCKTIHLRLEPTDAIVGDSVYSLNVNFGESSAKMEESPALLDILTAIGVSRSGL